MMNFKEDTNQKTNSVYRLRVMLATYKAPARCVAVFVFALTLIACGSGTKGGDGKVLLVNTLTSITDEPEGDNCAEGGQEVETGLDDNGDGVLDSDEVDDTDYVCNDDGSASLQGTIKLTGQGDHSGITVSLAGTDLSTTSDAGGGYSIANIPPGEYDIVFDAPEGSGYESGATLYDYRLFADIDDYYLTDVDLQLGRGILLSEGDGFLIESGGHGGRYYYDYYNSQISPDSSRAVYIVGYYPSNLYSVPIGGGTQTLLAEGVYDISLQISPDSSRVLYGDASGLDNLYSVPIGGGTPTLLAGGVSHIDISLSFTSTVKISPDSSRVIYSDGDLYSANLYSVPIGGGTPTKLAEGVYGEYAQISLDSSRVIYTDGEGSSVNGLYSVPLGGGTSVMLTSDVYGYPQISPDSVSVVYNTRSFNLDSVLLNLYSVPLGGGTPTLLAEAAGDYYLQISPDSSRVVYTDGEATSDRKLYSVPIGGGTAPLKLAEGVYYDSVQISPDSSRVIYSGGGSWENLYSVPIGGGTPTQLASDVYYGSVNISSDSTRVVYNSEDNPYNLYSVPIGGGATKLLAEGINYGSVISPDSSRVIYRDGDLYSANLYSVPIGGGTPTQLASDVSLLSVKISNDSDSLIYSRDFGVSTDNYDDYSSRLIATPLP